MHELHGEDWDIVMVSETWRVEKEELWMNEDGHLFAGVGHESGRKGVGILLRKKFANQIIRFMLICVRFRYWDVKMFGVICRFVSVYSRTVLTPTWRCRKLMTRLLKSGMMRRRRDTDSLQQVTSMLVLAESKKNRFIQLLGSFDSENRIPEGSGY